MKELPRNRLADSARFSMDQVFSTMLNLTAEPGAPHGGADGMETFDGVMALVGIAGAWTGTGRLLCSPKMACILAGSLLMSTYDAVDAEVLDAIAEIANMVVGNVKTMIEEDVGSLSLSVPTVIYGKNYATHSRGVQNWLIIPFKCLNEVIECRFCIMPAPADARAGFQIEAHQL